MKSRKEIENELLFKGVAIGSLNAEIASLEAEINDYLKMEGIGDGKEAARAV